MSKKGWRKELQDIINKEMFKEDLMIQIGNLIEKVEKEAEERGRDNLLLELIAEFGEWEHPLQFDNEYVQKFLINKLKEDKDD